MCSQQCPYRETKPWMTHPPLAIFSNHYLYVLMKVWAENSDKLSAQAGSHSRWPWKKIAYAGHHPGEKTLCNFCDDICNIVL